MTKIDDMILTILEHEGGYVDNEDDRGGPTNFGITMATYSAYYDKAVTAIDIKDMDVKDAKDIYKNAYFFKPRIDKLPEVLQPVVLDMCVNHGKGGGIKLLQRAFNNLFGLIAVDGGLGPITEGAITALLPEDLDKLVAEICAVRIRFYNNLVAKDETQWQFLKGWLIRANSFRV